jgi:hypothetical protein
MINGIMTLSGAWHKLRDDPILKFLITSLSFYGMSTFEDPMMSIKTVNALSHYTDWTVGHVHSGALGWVGMVSIGSMYYLIPKLFGRAEMYSTRLINVHFWLATLGTVLYIAALWISGVMQGLMWRATNADGTLTYSFVESVKASYPFWTIRVADLRFDVAVFTNFTRDRPFAEAFGRLAQTLFQSVGRKGRQQRTPARQYPQHRAETRTAQHGRRRFAQLFARWPEFADPAHLRRAMRARFKVLDDLGKTEQTHRDDDEVQAVTEFRYVEDKALRTRIDVGAHQPEHERDQRRGETDLAQRSEHAQVEQDQQRIIDQVQQVQAEQPQQPALLEQGEEGFNCFGRRPDHEDEDLRDHDCQHGKRCDCAGLYDPIPLRL